MDKIEKILASLLLRLQNGEAINRGEFQGKNKRIINNMIQDNILRDNFITKKHSQVICENTERLKSHLVNKYGITSNLEDYIQLLDSRDLERNQVLQVVNDDKFQKKRVFEGFLVNCYDEIWGILDNKKILLKPENGSFIFINEYQKFKIHADITVVGIENFENFKFIERQKYLFSNIKPLFVWRYQNSSSIADWLKIIENPYLHFGDFDLKGIHIYLSEFRNKINRLNAKFLIPECIFDKIKNKGRKQLYDTQYEQLKNFKFNDYEEIRELVQFIHNQKKGLPQEILINQED